MDYEDTGEMVEKLDTALGGEEKTRFMEVKVSVTDTEQFEEMLDWVQEILTDDRIDDEMREEYLEKLPMKVY